MGKLALNADCSGESVLPFAALRLCDDGPDRPGAEVRYRPDEPGIPAIRMGCDVHRKTERRFFRISFFFTVSRAFLRVRATPAASLQFHVFLLYNLDYRLPRIVINCPSNGKMNEDIRMAIHRQPIGNEFSFSIFVFPEERLLRPHCLAG
jgi:hypothetical protein